MVTAVFLVAAALAVVFSIVTIAFPLAWTPPPPHWVAALPEIVLFAAISLVAMLLWIYFILIIVEVILSWVGQHFRHPIVPLVYQLTGPVLRPIRRIIPPIAGIDLSPIFALIAIRFLLLLIGW